MATIYKNLPTEIQEVIDTKILVLNTKENMKSVLGELIGRNIYNQFKWYWVCKYPSVNGRRERNNYLKFICFDAIPYYIKEEGKNKQIDLILDIIDILKDLSGDSYDENRINNNLNLVLTGFIDIIDYYVVDMMDTGDFKQTKDNYNNLLDKLGFLKLITNDIDIDIDTWITRLKGYRMIFKHSFKLLFSV